MKPALVCVICVLMLCGVDETEAGIGELFDNIKHVFSVAWESMKRQFKPSHQQNLGVGGKLKTSSAPITTPAHLKTSNTTNCTSTLHSKANFNKTMPKNMATLTFYHYISVTKHAVEVTTPKIKIPYINSTNNVQKPVNVTTSISRSYSNSSRSVTASISENTVEV